MSNKFFAVRPAYNRFSGSLAERREQGRLFKAADRAAYNINKNICKPTTREQAELNASWLRTDAATSQYNWEVAEVYFAF